MVENRATLTRSRTATTRIAVAAVAVVAAGALAACGSDSEGDAIEKKPDNPGLQFSGTYKVNLVTTSANGVPPKPENGPTTSASNWIVQSTCDGPGDSCVAVAASTAPDPKRALNLDRMEFVYENGSWTRVFVPNERECVAYATGKPVDEPWVAMHSSTLSTTERSTADPVRALTGKFTSIQGGTCSGKTLGDMTLTRTGDVPAGTTPTGEIVAPAVAANPPGAAFRGTYDGANKPVSANPPSFITSAKAGKERYSVGPLCTRSGDRCVAITSAASGNPPTVYAYVNGGYERSAFGPKLNCTNGDTGYSRRTIRFDVPNEAGSPITTMASKQTLEILGGCPGTVNIEGTATRTGD